ncbi:MAG: hypothetical protein WCS84_07840 [Nocardioides sp.]
MPHLAEAFDPGVQGLAGLQEPLRGAAVLYDVASGNGLLSAEGMGWIIGNELARP